MTKKIFLSDIIELSKSQSVIYPGQIDLSVMTDETGPYPDGPHYARNGWVYGLAEDKGGPEDKEYESIGHV